MYIVQRTLSEHTDVNLYSLIDALGAVVGEQLWRFGKEFESFADFAIALPPNRLCVRFLRSLKLLRYALLANGHFAHWTDLWSASRVCRAGPRKNLVQDDGFERFYTVPTATTSRDRLLLEPLIVTENAFP